MDITTGLGIQNTCGESLFCEGLRDMEWDHTRVIHSISQYQKMSVVAIPQDFRIDICGGF